MSVSNAPSPKPSVECPLYEPLPGSRRCSYYRDGGVCSRPDVFMCVEWLKANGQLVQIPATKASARGNEPPAKEMRSEIPQVPPPARRGQRSEELLAFAPRDVGQRALFSSAPRGEAPRREPVRRGQVAHACTETQRVQPPPAGLTEADLASFKALGIAVRIATEAAGDVWLVPQYTGKDRKEIRIDHAAAIVAICSTFPGSMVTAIEKHTLTEKEDTPGKSGGCL